MRDKREELTASLGAYQSLVDETLALIREQRILERIREGDYSVWKDDPSEITNRLGWLHSPEVMADSIENIVSFVDSLRSDGITQALLLGMGGSSLAPEMFRKTFGVKEGYPDLSVLDSTDPGAVIEYSRSMNPANTIYIVSTKSGGTVETVSFMKHFYNRALEEFGPVEAGNHFVAITDPGSGLESIARKLQFRKIFLNDPNIGGRYSALSFFGMVPASIVGADPSTLLERARLMVEESASSSALLGSIMGRLAMAGRDKLTMITSPQVAAFGAWVEQLIAESTGKEGKGILPVDGEMTASPADYSDDRLFVYLRLEGSSYDEGFRALKNAGHPIVEISIGDLYDLGGEIFRWEMATAVAGHILGINPFDQPNVESAKLSAREMVSACQKEGALPEVSPTLEEGDIRVYTDIEAASPGEALTAFIEEAEDVEAEGGRKPYIAIQAYVKPSDDTTTAFQEFRSALLQRYGMATTFGYGPRFLHSTGQMHKGDAGNGLFIQFTADIDEDLPVPDSPGSKESGISFGILKDAQALGDGKALTDAGRRLIRFHLGRNIPGNLKLLLK